jgi:hypothetical protein
LQEFVRRAIPCASRHVAQRAIDVVRLNGNATAVRFLNEQFLVDHVVKHNAGHLLAATGHVERRLLRSSFDRRPTNRYSADKSGDLTRGARSRIGGRESSRRATSVRKCE